MFAQIRICAAVVAVLALLIIQWRPETQNKRATYPTVEQPPKGSTLRATYPVPRAEVDELMWTESYHDALLRVRQKRKPMAIFVGKGVAGYDEVCRTGELAAEVRAVLENDYVCLYLNVRHASDKKLASQFGIRSGTGLAIGDSVGEYQFLQHDGPLDSDKLGTYLKRFANPSLVAKTTIHRRTRATSPKEAEAPRLQTWYTDYSKALSQVRKLQKPMAIVVASGAKGYERICDKEELGNEARDLFSEHYVCLYLDANDAESKRLAPQFGIRSGRGLAVGDAAGQYQLLQHDGSLSQTDLDGYLKRFADHSGDVRTTVARRSLTEKKTASRVEVIRWRTEYSVAMKEAAKRNVPILVDIGHDSCERCRKLDTTTFRNKDVVRLLNSQFVPIKLKKKDQAQLAEALEVETFPTVIVASPNGTILSRRAGFVGAADMQKRLQRIAARDESRQAVHETTLHQSRPEPAAIAPEMTFSSGSC